MKNLFVSLILVVMIFCNFTVSAEWRVKTEIDSMTDKERKEAIVENNLGHSFSVYRLDNALNVWGSFRLSNKSIDQIDNKNLIIFRIDKNNPVDLSEIARMQDSLEMHLYSWTPKWITFNIWHGKGNIPNDLILNLMEGNKIVVRHFSPTGGYKETTFTLKGAKKAISTSLGLKQVEINELKNQASKKKEYTNYYGDKMMECVRSSARTRDTTCTTKIIECGDKFPENQEGNLDKLKNCIVNQGL